MEETHPSGGLTEKNPLCSDTMVFVVNVRNPGVIAGQRSLTIQPFVLERSDITFPDRQE